MKKILLISLVTVLAVSLVGCNGNNNDIEVDNPSVNPGISGEVNNNESNNENEDIENSGNNNTNNETVNPEHSGENVTPNIPDSNEENIAPNVPENDEQNTESNNPEDDKEVVTPSEPENNEQNTESNDPAKNPEDNEENETPNEPENNEGNVESGEGEMEEEPIVVSELEGKINTLMQNSGVQVRMPMAMPIEAEAALTYVGLTEAQFNANVKEAVAYESMIMPSNFSLCLIELNDSANVAEVKKSVIDNCDLNKWICAWADKAIVVDSGKYIMLVMSTAEDCDALQNAFVAEFGTTGEVLSKTNQ